MQFFTRNYNCLLHYGLIYSCKYMHHLYIPVRKRERPHSIFLFGMVIFLIFLINLGLPYLNFLFAKHKVAGTNKYYILHMRNYIIF